VPAHNHENIDVTVVVSGQPERLKVNVHQTLEHLVRDALQRSNNQGQAPSDWELRTEDGQLLDQSQTIATAAPGLGVPMRRPMFSRLPFKRIAIGLSATCLAMVVLDAATGNMHAGNAPPDLGAWDLGRPRVCAAGRWSS